MRDTLHPVAQMAPHDDHIKTINGIDYVNFDIIVAKVIAEINKTPQQITPLARAAIDARAVLEENCSQLGATLEDFQARTKLALDTIRQTRFAFVTETTAIMGPLKEVRQFFLGQDWQSQIQRLESFCDLCERLQRLKESGFLDAVADTMIKLA